MIAKVVPHPAERAHHGGAHPDPGGAPGGGEADFWSAPPDDIAVDNGGWSADLAADWNIGNGASEFIAPFIEPPEAAGAVYNGGSVVDAAPAGAGNLAPGSASGSTTSSGGSPSGPSLAAGTVSGGLVINLIWDSAALAAPQSFRDAVQAGADALEAVITNNITVNINVGYGEIPNDPITINQTSSYGDISYQGNLLAGIDETYPNLISLLTNSETSSADVISVNALPGGPSLNGVSDFTIGSAEAKVFGVLPADDTAVDGTIGFGTEVPAAELTAAAEHEIAHAMGRVPGASVLSLFRYTAPGTHDFDGSIPPPPQPPSYFSIDGGATTLAHFGETSDPSDFLGDDLTVNDPFDEFSGPATQAVPTSLDLLEMDVLGFQIAPENFSVSAGQFTGNTIIYSGDNEYVQSGGTSFGTYALGGGLEVISAGGTDLSATISSGAEQDVFGSGSAGTIYYSGLQVVEAGGTANATTVSSGGSQVVSSGGTVIGAMLQGDAAIQTIKNGGTASATTVGNGASESVSSGGSAVSTTVGNGGDETVWSGGTAIDTTLLNGGTVDLMGGAIVSGLNWSGGDLTLGAGYVLSGQTVGPNQSLTIVASASAVSTTVSGGGLMTVFGGGKASLDTIGNGGTETVAGGRVTSETIDQGGSLVESAGGSATSTMVHGGTENILSGGSASYDTVSGGGDEFVLGFGSSFSATIENGGMQGLLQGGISYYTAISNGGSQTVSSSSFSNETTIWSGGSETVSPGGTSSENTVEAGGFLEVLPQGVTNFSQINSGGNEALLGGEAYDTTVAGGALTVFASGSAFGTFVSGGSVVVSVGGLAEVFTINNGGHEIVDQGGIASATTISSGGVETVSSGGETVGNRIDASGTMDLLAGAVVSGGITFAGRNTQLAIAGAPPPVPIAGFTASGDTVDLTGLTFAGNSGVAFNSSTYVLTVVEGGMSATIDLSSGSYGGIGWTAQSDGVSGTEVLIPCYCRDTLIATQSGEKQVQQLEIGDEVVTASGAARPVKWIGRRSYSGRFILGGKDILPVCIRAGALADNVPRRDLWISPRHAMYLDGMLIEAKDLMNGTSIVQTQRVEKVEYFHIELETHDVIFAEGAAAETFIDDDSRGMFHNATEFAALYPDAANKPACYCAPRVGHGYELEAARRRIALRAGLLGATEANPVAALRGQVDLVSSRCVAGWAQNSEYPDAPVCLDIFSGDRLIGRTLACSYRSDLQTAGIGDGRHGFKFLAPEGLDLLANAVRVRRSFDGKALKCGDQVFRQRRANV